MIGRGSIEREPEELFKGQPVVDLIFDFGIGVDVEPLLKEHTLEKQQGWVRIGTFPTSTDGIVSHQDLFNAIPKVS
jgi:hypothetical protein